jgi:hypothetical protein
VELPDIGTVPGVGLTLIVGPNSAGKTRLLNDLNSRLCEDPRNSVVARRIELNKPEYQPLIDCLKDEGYIRISFEGGRDQLVVKTPYLGTGEVQQPIAMDQVRGWYDAYPIWEGVDSDRQNEFLLRIGRLLKAGFGFAEFPRVSAYLDAVRARPAWKETPKLPGL